MQALKNRTVEQGTTANNILKPQSILGERRHGNRNSPPQARKRKSRPEMRTSLQRLLKQSFKPRTERAATELDNAVKTLVEQALADTSLIKSDVLDTIEEMIAQLDKKLSAQMNEIMHAPEFQQIEGAWRGLKYLVFQSETDAMLKIRVMNVSKNELYRHLRLYPNAAWDQSPLFKKIYEEEFGQLGRTALRLPDRRLSLQPSGDRRAVAARPQQDRRRGACAVLCRRGFRP